MALKVLEIKGKDALSFLHRLLATSAKLEVGRGNRGLLLTGQSKVIAQFDLLRKGEEQFWLVSPQECFMPLKEELEKMHFSEDLVIEEGGAAKIFAGEGAGELEFSFSSHWPCVVPGFICGLGEGELPQKFHHERIRHLVPWPLCDWNKNTNALEAGFLPWIDRNKGCYPGQEVVEKSLNVGHPAKVLVALEGSGSLEGWEITSQSEENSRTIALVRVPWSKKDLPVAGFKIIKTHF